MTGIDWDAQLKKIERQFEGKLAPPSESELRAQRENERREAQRRKRREESFGAASRVVLVLSLGLAMNAWPYDRACGGGLLGYLAASVAIGVGAMWATIGTWRSRTPRLHALALLALAWAIVLVTAQVLPRVGYAAVEPGNAPAWRCWRDGQASVGVPVVNGLLNR